jgi:hypothetical protein
MAAVLPELKQTGPKWKKKNTDHKEIYCGVGSGRKYIGIFSSSSFGISCNFSFVCQTIVSNA